MPTNFRRALLDARDNPQRRFLVFLDEFNRCRPMARNGLMPALDTTRKVYDPETGEWSGRAYSIKRDREVRIDIALPSRDELELTAHILIFTKDVEFKRVPSSKVASLRGKRGL